MDLTLGFESIQDAIYFRLTLEDNIDRCAFFESLSKGWYEMYVWSEDGLSSVFK